MIRYQVKEGCRVKIQDRVYTGGEVIEFDVAESDASAKEALEDYLLPKINKLIPVDKGSDRPSGGYMTREMSPKDTTELAIEPSEDFED